MVFKKGDYMHEKCMDVFIEVVAVEYQDRYYTRLKVLWWNLGWTGECWVIDPEPESININSSEYENWKQLGSRRRHAQEVLS